MKGYKAFNKDLTCRGFQYEIGKQFEHKGKIGLCESGFHFCKRIVDIRNYYNLNDEDTRICEIEAIGEIIEGEDKCVTNKIKIIKEITKEEMYKLGNEGKLNTGLGNTGDWNKTDRSSGVFCNKEPKLIMFNKETNITWEEWKNSEAYYILTKNIKSKWIDYEDMTDKEKEEYPSAKTCNGYLKEIERAESSKKWWNELEIKEKAIIIQLPNFDLDIFNDIMELEISKEEYEEILEWSKLNKEIY